MYCKKCGKQIAVDSEFCTYCGTRQKAAKMEDIIRTENDADGDSYIAVNSPDVKEPVFQELKKKEPQLYTEPVRDTEPEGEQESKFQSFVDEDKKQENKNKTGLFVGIAVVGALVIIAAVAFALKGGGDEKTQKVVLSEQTAATAQLVTTVKQTETQAQEEKNGFFERTYSDGSKYSGNFKDGVWDGEGTYTSSTGIIYKGSFTNGAITGTGKITYTDGHVYEGEYKNAQRDGKGTLYYNNGSKYMGAFVADKRSGSGQIWYANGDYFNGYFVNDVKQGYGEYIYASGQSYKGEYQNDLAEGYGQLNYSDKEYYRGSFKGGEKNGYGEYIMANGDVVSGNWTSDDMTGYFTYANAQTGEVELNVYYENGVPKEQ